jgi:hypothetical protein
LSGGFPLRVQRREVDRRELRPARHHVRGPTSGVGARRHLTRGRRDVGSCMAIAATIIVALTLSSNASAGAP